MNQMGNNQSLLPAPDVKQQKTLLNVIAVVAILDFLLLIPLVLGTIGVIDNHKEILGPIHGFGYMILVGLTAYGASKRFWGWWFPLITIITLGPLGSLWGDLKIRKDLAKLGLQYLL